MDCSGARSSGLGSPVAPVPAAAGAAAEPAHGGGANAPSIAPVALMPASAGVVDAAALPAAPPPLRRRSRLLCRLDRKKSTTAGSRSKKSTHSLETIDEDVCRFRQPGVNQEQSLPAARRGCGSQRPVPPQRRRMRAAGLSVGSQTGPRE